MKRSNLGLKKWQWQLQWQLQWKWKWKWQHCQNITTEGMTKNENMIENRIGYKDERRSKKWNKKRNYSKSHIKSYNKKHNKSYINNYDMDDLKNEEGFNICTPFNNNLHIQHERYDQTFYLYNIHSTIFRLLKYIHLFKKRYKLNNNYYDCTYTTKKEQQKLEQLFMCYISIYKQVPVWSFLKITTSILQVFYWNQIIMNDKNILRSILCKVLLCRKDIKVTEKHIFYNDICNMCAALLTNSTFLGEHFERIFFFKLLRTFERDNNIKNLDIAKNITFLLSCLSNYKRTLKKDILTNFKKGKNSIQWKNLTTPHLYEENVYKQNGYEQNGYEQNVYKQNLCEQNLYEQNLCEQKMNALINSSTIFMNILSKIEKYNNFCDKDICNILDFLNEFKKTHTIQLAIAKHMYKYFTISSKIKTLCLSLYFVSHSCSNYVVSEASIVSDLEVPKISEISKISKVSKISTVSENMYRYLYDMICLKQKDLCDLESLHYFMLAVTKYKCRQRKTKEIFLKQKKKKTKEPYYTFYIKDRKQKHYSKILLWILCDKLKKKYKKHNKSLKEKNMYFFIKKQCLQFLQKVQFNKKQKIQEKLQKKYLKSFSQFFSLYHLDQKKTRKKNYTSPLVLIQSYQWTQ